MAEVQATATSPLRTRIYVDGYNLYYGCLKSTPYKWLDLMMLFERCILPSSAPAESILLPLSIKFFTAKILEKAAKALDSVSSQARYHTALRKLYSERIELIEGYYSLIESKAKLVNPAAPETGHAIARKRWFGSLRKNNLTLILLCRLITMRSLARSSK